MIKLNERLERGNSKAIQNAEQLAQQVSNTENTNPSEQLISVA